MLMAGFKRVLIICPPHLVRKWKREVEETVPGVRAVIVTSITDLERLRLSVGAGPLFALMSRERAKLSYRWKAAVIYRWATSKGRLIRVEETGEPFRVPCCPVCTAQITDKDGVPLTDADLNRRKRTCAALVMNTRTDRLEVCGSPLWQADGSGPARYPLSDYVKHHMPGFFDLLIGDEVHEFKARGSAQGIAAGVLADACGKSLSLTGTLLGGYASTIFHLLYRFSPEIRTEFGRSDEGRWIKRYGFEEVSVGKDDDPQDLRYVREALARSGYDPVVTGEPEEALRLVADERPELVLLDLMLPGTDGIELMKDILDVADVPVIFLSVYGREEVIARAFDMGAADYVVKPFSPTELAARIRAALRRRATSEPVEPYVLGDLTIDYGERSVTLAGRPVEMVAMEYRMLAELSANGGRVLTYQRLLERVWGERGDSDMRPMRTLINKLRRKLGDVGANPTYIFTERNVGYRMPKGEERGEVSHDETPLKSSGEHIQETQ